MNESNFLKVAKYAALEAGKVISKYSGRIHQRSAKFEDKSDFFTETDLDAEKVIVSILSRAFPKHNIVGEEKEKANKGSEYTWVIDPLDGTTSFAINNPFYSVSIGLLYKSFPILGVIFHVSTNELYMGEKDKGAFVNGKAIHVSSRQNLEEAVIVMDLGHRKRRQQKFDEYVDALKNKVGYIYSFGGLVASLGLVAKGVLDGGVSQAWIWDFVAGAVIVSEAGGKVTDFAGKEPDWTQDRLSIIASNGLIHDQILEALR